MTPFASVAIFRTKGGKTIFKQPRKERPTNVSQARKAAMRYWRTCIGEGDLLHKVILVREINGQLSISERADTIGRELPWTEHTYDLREAPKLPHIAACMELLGVDPQKAPPPMPDVLEINGVRYIREI